MTYNFAFNLHDFLSYLSCSGGVMRGEGEGMVLKSILWDIHHNQLYLGLELVETHLAHLLIGPNLK